MLNCLGYLWGNKYLIRKTNILFTLIISCKGFQWIEELKNYYKCSDFLALKLELFKGVCLHFPLFVNYGITVTCRH